MGAGNTFFVVSCIFGLGSAFLGGYLLFPLNSCEMCQLWSEFELSNGATEFLDRLPDCPCTVEPLEKAAKEGTLVGGHRWRKDFNPFLSQFHPNASYSFRSEGVDSWWRHAQQCTYTKEGKLITGDLGAGTPDRYAAPPRVVSHYIHDAFTFQVCCSWCNQPDTCFNTYFVNRAPNVGVGCPPLRAGGRTLP